MGNRPKPTALKLLQGNPGRRPINKAEPKPKRGIPAMPKWLDAFPVAVEEWKRESKRHLSRFRKHKQGPPIRYDPREELSFLDADETRES